jgi:hypothetical protein
MKETLDEIGIRHFADKSSRGHNSLRYYEEYLENLREDKINLLEIGIAQGASLRMWYDYFSQANIFGIDCPNSEGGNQMGITEQDMREMENDRVKNFIVDQGDRERLNNFKENSPLFDVIIDDGHHYQDTQQISLGSLFLKLKPGGLYVIEDIQYYIYGKWGIEDLENYSDSTYKIIENFNKNKRMESVFLTKEENEYLEKNILGEINLIHDSPSDIIAFIRKK